MKLTFFIFSIFLFCSLTFAQEKPEFKLVQYYFVELIRNPDKPQIDSTKIMEIQAGHMENMRTMAEAGKLLCAGPFGDNNGGGIWVLKVDTMEEAESLCENDPAVKNNRLLYKIRPWWTAEGTFSAEKKD